MKLGEIKSQALYLSFPNPELILDTSDMEAMSAKLGELKADPSYADFLMASAGAINRALSALEIRGLTPLGLRALSAIRDEAGGYTVLDASVLEDMFSVEGVFLVKGGVYSPVPFEHLGENRLCLPFSESGKAYLVKYRKSLDRISSVTSESYELPLPEALASLIPYFVKGDLLSAEEPEASRVAMAYFDIMCASYPKDGEGVANGVFSVYGTEADI